MSIKAAEKALFFPNQSILIIALTERQAYELFNKTLNYLMFRFKDELVLKGKQKPTKHIIHLKNGSIIRCLPTGLSGNNIRGFTINKLFIDEASRISDDVFTAVTPMLAVTGGTIDLASTPAGKQGYYYEMSKNPTFKQFYVSAETCPRMKPEFLEFEKKTKSEMQYAQEYLAVFLDDLKRLFSDSLIKKSCILKRKSDIPPIIYYIGVDVARLGTDESTFEIIGKIDTDKAEQFENVITRKNLTTETADNIVRLAQIYSPRNIFIDDGGVGAGVFDMLLREDKTRNKTIAINNASKSLDRDDKRKRRILKEDLYMNLLALLEKNRLKLLDDDEIIASLKSVQYEYVIKEGKQTSFRIFGNYTHIVEGLIRAAWGLQSKRLELWCA